MKKRYLLLFLLVFMFIPSVYAESVSTFNISTEMVKNGSFYGEEYPLSSQSSEIQKYDSNISICNQDSSICNRFGFDNSQYIELQPGTYKIGFGVKLKNGYTFGDNIKWIINDEEINPTECGQSGDDVLGCDSFYTVEIKKPTYINSVSISDVKTDYKVGDVPNYNYTIVDADKDLYDITEIYWRPGLDSNETVTKFERKKYYLFITVESKDEKYHFINNVPVTFNGKARPQFYLIDEDTGEQYEPGKGCATGFGVFYYELDLTNYVDVEPENTKSEEEKKAAEESSKVLSKALSDLADGKEVKGISEETANKVKLAVEDGQTITTDITVEPVNVDTLSDDVKKAFEEKKNSTDNVIGFFDINLLIKADGEELGKITELQDKIAITVDAKDLVKDLPKVENGKKRIYKVLRLHDGVVDVLDAELNDDGTLTIYTDRFSNYAIVYEDVVAKNPKTGDFIHIYVSLMIVGLGGMYCLIKYLNKGIN